MAPGTWPVIAYGHADPVGSAEQLDWASLKLTHTDDLATPSNSTDQSGNLARAPSSCD